MGCMLTPGAMRQSWGLQWDWRPKRFSKKALQDWYPSVLQYRPGKLQWVSVGAVATRWGVVASVAKSTFRKQALAAGR